MFQLPYDHRVKRYGRVTYMGLIAHVSLTQLSIFLSLDLRTRKLIIVIIIIVVIISFYSFRTGSS